MLTELRPQMAVMPVEVDERVANAVTSESAQSSKAGEPLGFHEAVRMVEQGGQSALKRATMLLLGSLKQEERLWLLDGDQPFWKGLRGILMDRYNREAFVMGEIPRLNIPGIRFTDGPRGVVMGASTCFPVSMARGASWDVELERRIGNAIGLEARAQGANYFAGICINLPRHPAWGRIQETYGEDQILLGEFGVALHRGVRKHVMTCVKHFALNSMENARFKVDVQADDQALHEVYLPHFRRLVEDGVTSVMSSYNSVRGDFAGENHELLNETLRQEWGFEGFVLSDFIFGLRNAAKSVKNGLDIEAPFRQQRELHLVDSLERGELPWSDVDRACSRILAAQIEHVVRTGTAVPASSVVFCDEHRKLAREAASRGVVLLKNEEVSGSPLLPIDSNSLKSLAIVGRLANRENTGDRGSSAVFAPEVVTLYEGLKAALPNVRIMLEDTDSVEGARRAARSADTVICVVGYDAADEGEYVVPSFKDQKELLDLLPPELTAEDKEVRRLIEGQDSTGFGSGSDANDGLVPGAGGDRRSLRLRQRDVDIIDAVSSVSSHVIVNIVAAGAVIMEEWIEKVPAVTMGWYSGAEGGHGLADVFLGKVDASGRMPFSVPRSESHLPYFDIDAQSITYDRWFGQRLLDKLGVTARFPLGHGLSYTTFVMQGVKIEADAAASRKEDCFIVKTEVKNIGRRAGRHVVQIYGTPRRQDFPTRVLLGFQPIALEPSQSEVVRVKCSYRPLRQRSGNCFIPVERSIGIEVASYAGDPNSLRAKLAMPWQSEQ